ncbi:MAG TPA: ATP phosphoribosyltransferase [bacterium]|nr:ATP phosphoribosyltransferase [bacterium]
MSDRLKLAIQSKGRIGNVIPDFLRRAGLNFEIFDRQLISRCSNFPLDLLFVRHRDIPVFVEDGAADLGIVGQDLLWENNNDVAELLNLGFGRCRLCLAVPEETKYRKATDLKGLRVATSLPNLTTEYFSKKLIPVEVIAVEGSVEIGPRLNIAEAIVDVVGTGSTLEINRMRIIDEILRSETVLIGNQESIMTRKNLVDELVFRCGSVVAADTKKLMLFTVAEDKLDACYAVISSSIDVTVTRANGTSGNQFVSIQLVVDEEESWSLMRALKLQGAKIIFVTDIQRLVT